MRKYVGYYPVQTGETAKSIATLCEQDDASPLLDLNRDNISVHLNLISGADGKRTDSEGVLIPVRAPEAITEKTKLVEGIVFVLPDGWTATREDEA